MSSIFNLDLIQIAFEISCESKASKSFDAWQKPGICVKYFTHIPDRKELPFLREIKCKETHYFYSIVQSNLSSCMFNLDQFRSHLRSTVWVQLSEVVTHSKKTSHF